MLKKTITFEDTEGKKITEDFYFHVGRSDMVDLLVEKPELETRLQSMAQNMDGRSIVVLLKEFMLLGVGKREEGGRKFVKNQAVIDDFRYSGAYDSLYWELINDPVKANEFLEALFPASLIEEIKKTGKIDDIQSQVAAGKPLNEIDLSDTVSQSSSESSTTTELPSSGRIDTVEGEVTSDPRSPFPNSLPKAVAAQSSTREDVEDDRPAWLRELREPTSKELLEMNKPEMALAFKMREEGKLNVAQKRPE